MRLRALFIAILVVFSGSAPAMAASPFGAFVRSLLVPGWAQSGNNQSNAATRFLVAEGILWSGYFGMTAVSSIREENYRTYASAHAGASYQGKGGVYFDDLGFYMNQQQHDLFALVDGADEDLYGDQSDNTWEWDQDASRKRYRALRNSARSAERSALFATGLVLVNHLVAAIHAARTAEGDGFSGAPAWRLEPFASRLITQGLSLVRRF
jgi:hypothetical protein